MTASEESPPDAPPCSDCGEPADYRRVIGSVPFSYYVSRCCQAPPLKVRSDG